MAVSVNADGDRSEIGRTREGATRCRLSDSFRPARSGYVLDSPDTQNPIPRGREGLAARECREQAFVSFRIGCVAYANYLAVRCK